MNHGAARPAADQDLALMHEGHSQPARPPNLRKNWRVAAEWSLRKERTEEKNTTYIGPNVMFIGTGLKKLNRFHTKYVTQYVTASCESFVAKAAAESVP